MAARRLIMFMLALLVLSSVAAALVPVDSTRLEDALSTSTDRPSARPEGALVEANVDADSGRRQRIALALGDRLALAVSARTPDLVAIEGLGETDDVDPNAPATFDLLPTRPGRYPVRLLGAERTIARIDVAARRS